MTHLAGHSASLLDIWSREFGFYFDIPVMCVVKGSLWTSLMAGAKGGPT